MSQENVEIIRGVYAAMNRGDREEAIGLAHPEVVLDATRSVFNPKTYYGRDGLRQWLSDTEEIWEGMHTEQNEFVDAGDRVVRGRTDRTLRDATTGARRGPSRADPAPAGGRNDRRLSPRQLLAAAFGGRQNAARNTTVPPIPRIAATIAAFRGSNGNAMLNALSSDHLPGPNTASAPDSTVSVPTYSQPSPGLLM